MLVLQVTPHLHGFWQDDVLHFSAVFQRRGELPAALVRPFGTPMRLFYLLPYWLAYFTPRPLLALHAIHAFFWIAEALLAGWIARLLAPRRTFVRFAAIALTLTATSDYLTNNLTPLGYHLAIVMLLVATGCGLRFRSSGGWPWLVLAVSSLTFSVWTVDLAFVAMPFLPLLLFLPSESSVDRIAERRRALLLLAVCALATAPAAVREVQFLRDPHDYAAVAIQHLPLPQLAARAAHLCLENFRPWRWVFTRPRFGARPSPVIPMSVQASLALVAALAFFLRARSRPAESRSSMTTLRFAVLFVLMACVFNVLYARLQMADVHNRTHLMSRVWASLAIAFAAGWARDRWPGSRVAIHILLALFIGFGAWGGIERQDLFLGAWRRHQRELASILDAVPRFRPGTQLVLRSGNTSFYMATEADYLANCWLRLFYDEPFRLVRLSPKRPDRCRSTPAGLECTRETRFAPEPVHVDYATMIVLDYDEATGRYTLLPTLQGDPLGAGGEGAEAAYQPRSLIEDDVRSMEHRSAWQSMSP
ncbi:MAG: hypothetical protein JOZ54_19215 [Acidobacteria bacterium]|nr:hypothetical protein [Acidobacteriota bacterium]